MMYYTYTGGVIDIEELHDIEKHATPCPVSERFPLHVHTLCRNYTSMALLTGRGVCVSVCVCVCVSLTG